jgi:cytoskeletal protein RodZ
MSVGSSLREVRKSAGFSTAELASRTRIPESVIEDLEKDNFNTSGGAAYARGHIRTIARICGVSPEEILAQFESQTIPLNKSIRELLNDNNAAPTLPMKKPISWKSLTGVVAGFVVLGVFGIALVTGNSNGGSTRDITQKPVNENSAVAQKRDGVEVVVRAVNGLSWVAVNDSTGTTQFSGRLRQGEERTFTDNQLLYLVIGNAGAIQLIVNGEDLGVTGRVGEVVRLEFGPQALSSQG